MAKLTIPRSFADIGREAARVARDPALLLWSVYLFLFPMYPFPSGLPQPSDLVAIILLPVALAGWRGRLHRPSSRALRALLWFTLWVVVVDYTWMLVLGKFDLIGGDAFILVPSYYIYNAIVFLIALVLYQRYGERMIWLTLHMVLIAAVFNVAYSFIHPTSHGGRGIVMFNNPNQLGFYSLLGATILALGRRRLGFGALKAAVGFAACTYLALLSASKAALGGTALLFMVSILSNPRTIIAFALVAAGLLFAGGPVDDAITKAQTRFDKQSQYGFFEERGYDRIAAHQEYWLLGAGESGLSRFKGESIMSSHELHSSAGTLFFSYGIVGCVLFLVFMARVLEGAAFRTGLLIVPALAYTAAHQGLRFTMLWVMLGLFIAAKHQAMLAKRGRPR